MADGPLRQSIRPYSSTMAPGARTSTHSTSSTRAGVAHQGEPLGSNTMQCQVLLASKRHTLTADTSQLPPACVQGSSISRAAQAKPASSSGEGSLTFDRPHTVVVAAAAPQEAPSECEEAREDQQAKRRKVEEPQQVLEQTSPQQDLAAADADVDVPDVEAELERLAAQIDALSRQMDTVAAGGHAAADAAGSRDGSPAVVPVQDQNPLHPTRSPASGGVGGAAAAGLPAAAVVQDAPQRHPSARVLGQHKEAVTQYAKMRAKADMEAAKAAADAKAAAHAGDVAAVAPANTLHASAVCSGEHKQVSNVPSRRGGRVKPRHVPTAAVVEPWAEGGVDDDDEEKLKGTPGYVPKWLREWRPKARAAARAARAKEQRRRAPAQAKRRSRETPLVTAGHQHKQKQQKQQQTKLDQQQQPQHINAQLSGSSSGQQQHHTHLAWMLEALIEDAGGSKNPNMEAVPAAAAAAVEPAPAPPAAAAASAAAAVAPIAVAPAAAGRLVKQEVSGAAGPACFMFSASMLPAVNEAPRSSSAGSKRHHSPEVDPGAQSALPSSHTSSPEPDVSATAAAGPGMGPTDMQQLEGSYEPSGGVLCSLPKREWAKLSAAAGFAPVVVVGHEHQPLPQQRGPSSPPRYRPPPRPRPEVSFGGFRGVCKRLDVEVYDAQIPNSCLGKVFSLVGFPDPASAARARDLTVLSLAQSGLMQAPLQLNLPAEQYEGALLPNLRELSGVQMRSILKSRFEPAEPAAAHSMEVVSGGVAQAKLEVMPSRLQQHHMGGSSSIPGLPPPDGQQLQHWLPAVAPAADGGAAEPGTDWGRTTSSSPQPPAVLNGQQQQQLNAANTGAAAISAASGLRPQVGGAAGGRPDALPAVAGSQGVAAAAAASAAPPAAAGFHLLGVPAVGIQEMQRLRQHQQQLLLAHQAQLLQHHFIQQMLTAPPQQEQMLLQSVLVKADPMLVDKPRVVPAPTAPLQPPAAQQHVLGAMPQQELPAEQALLAKMQADLQKLSSYSLDVQLSLQQFRHELTTDAAALEAACVSSETGRHAQDQVQRTLLTVEACSMQQRAVQQLLTETMQLLQPALTDAERERLQRNSVQLAPALEALGTSLSQVCKAVLAAAVAQDAAACAEVLGSGADTPGLATIPVGSARAKRMTRLSKAIRAAQDNMTAAKKLLRGQAQ